MSSSGASRGLSGVVARVSNFAKQNGTPTILQATAPADGNSHLAFISGWVKATVAETGGACTATVTIGGVAQTMNFDVGAHGAGVTFPCGGTFGSNQPYGGILIDSGSTVTIAQSSALTAGASTVSAEILIL